MEFVTVYESFSANRVHILRGILEQYGIRCRVLKAPVDKVVPKGMRLQVDENKEVFAYQIIRENGYVVINCISMTIPLPVFFGSTCF